MRTSILCIAVVLLAGTARSAAAQAWDMPSFFAPRPGEDIGVYVTRPEGIDELGFAAIWRMEGNLNLGVRGGIAGDDHYSLGAEFHRPIGLFGPQSPVLLSWLLGLGATFNEATLLRVPLGVSAGMLFGQPGSVRLLPYAFPKVALELLVLNVDGREQTDTDFRFDIDLGADAHLGDAFVVRVGATLGESNTFGAGIAYRYSRRLIVR